MEEGVLQDTSSGMHNPTSHNPVRAAKSYPGTSTVYKPSLTAPQCSRDGIRRFLRQLGITEPILIHEQDYNQFLVEKGIKELGRGGEATVYFLRGHVVKVANPDSAPAVLREIAHMLHLNRIAYGSRIMGERMREDWPALLWVYALSDGSISIGMKPFDHSEAGATDATGATGATGATLYEHLALGPALERQHTLDILGHIGRSLVYAHQNGIIHHDLKPSNIYIPADPAQRPVVFDLAQALWHQPSWGRQWSNHEHNSTYWYNGTYRYMHHQRRLAHLGAVALVEKRAPTAAEEEGFQHYRPSFYDDVFAFARILFDLVRSMNTWLSEKDRVVLRGFYRHLMSLKEDSPGFSAKHSNRFLLRIREALGSSSQAALAKYTPPAVSMEQVQPALEKTLENLL
ncbi:MAG: serine/threonine-protein kinase [Planctomycetota bacterium]